MVAPAGDSDSSSSSGETALHRGASGRSVGLPGHPGLHQQQQQEEEEGEEEEERRRLMVTPQRLQEAVEEAAQQQQQQQQEQHVSGEVSGGGHRDGASRLHLPAGSTSGRGGRGHRVLHLYSGHDTTLMPLLSALGQELGAWPHFAGHLVFELWEVPEAGVQEGLQRGVHQQQPHHQQQQQQRKHVHYVRILYDGQPLRWQQLASGAVQSHWSTPAAAAGTARRHGVEGAPDRSEVLCPVSRLGRLPSVDGAARGGGLGMQQVQLQPEGGWLALEQLQNLLQPFAADRSTHARECKL
jgi:hypothetical protein